MTNRSIEPQLHLLTQAPIWFFMWQN